MEEEHFLSHLVSGDSEFHPHPRYNRQGDCIVHKIANEAVVADRIDGLLTLYRSAIDGRVIGYEIKGVLALLRKFGWDGIAVECSSDDQENTVERISLAGLLLAAFSDGPSTIGRRSAYAQSFQDAADSSIPHADLLEV